MKYSKKEVNRLFVKKSMFGLFGYKGFAASDNRPRIKAGPPPVRGRFPAGYSGAKPPGKDAAKDVVGMVGEKIAVTPEGREVSQSLNQPATHPAPGMRNKPSRSDTFDLPPSQ